MLNSFNLSPVRHSSETIDLVKAIVGYDRYPSAQEGEMKLVCGILADVFSADENQLVRVGGAVTTAGYLKIAYRKLTPQLVFSVYDKYAVIRPRIKNRRAYLITALYNAANENPSQAPIATYNKDLVEKMLKDDGENE